jgi:hypothetical protein
MNKRLIVLAQLFYHTFVFAQEDKRSLTVEKAEGHLQ